MHRAVRERHWVVFVSNDQAVLRAPHERLFHELVHHIRRHGQLLHPSPAALHRRCQNGRCGISDGAPGWRRHRRCIPTSSPEEEAAAPARSSWRACACHRYDPAGEAGSCHGRRRWSWRSVALAKYEGIQAGQNHGISLRLPTYTARSCTPLTMEEAGA